ncbi:heterokaryon incompatibility protein-domain-containing protein [Xylaria scruposa]|nr:heterokaryon incompatibility protein-domain-containing protein [Xylaria scruposa]
MNSINMSLTASISYRSHLLDHDDSFRLVYLEPGQKNDVISVRLENARLSDTPPYEALSYTWGDATQTTTIQISNDLNGSKSTVHGISLNCYSALQRLRRPDEHRALWIDAICINQESIVERNHQLGLMATIYAKASEVIVYLGEGDEESDAAMDIVANTVDPQDRYIRLFKINGIYLQDVAPDNCVVSLFRRPWFSRIWVLQEIANAQRATVYCGSKELSWESFRDFVHLNVAMKQIEYIPYAMQYCARRPPPHWSGVTTRLLKILIATRSCGATDPRDKVFALIPLLEREQRLFCATNPESPPESPRNIPIDATILLSDISLNYSLSPCNVFINLAVYFLKHIGLDILRQIAGPASRLDSLPSWAPDWSQPPESRYRNIEIRPHDVLRDPDLTWDYKISSFHELRVEAINCGVVTSIGGLFDIDHDHFPVSQWKRLVPQEYLEYSNRDEGSPFERLIVANHMRYPSAVRRALNTMSESDESSNSVRNIRNKPSRYRNPSSRFRRILTGMVPSYAGQAKLIFQTCDKRRLLVTDGGKIGLAPANVEEGDMIFFITGSSVPFLLRKFTVIGQVGDNYYKLIGEGFLQGVTDGENTSQLEHIVII